MIAPKTSTYTNFDRSLLEGFHDKNSQGLIYGMMKPLYLRFAFLYMRPGTGSKKQIETILTSYGCNDCDVIMGDLNLNPKNPSELQRIQQLCNGNLQMALQEETTTDSKNQIDHILAHKTLKGRIFVTSYVNFATTHKLIVARIGTHGNELSKETVRKLQHTSKKFMKKKIENTEEVHAAKYFPFTQTETNNELPLRWGTVRYP